MGGWMRVATHRCTVQNAWNVARIDASVSVIERRRVDVGLSPHPGDARGLVGAQLSGRVALGLCANKNQSKGMPRHARQRACERIGMLLLPRNPAAPVARCARARLSCGHGGPCPFPPRIRRRPFPACCFRRPHLRNRPPRPATREYGKESKKMLERKRRATFIGQPQEGRQRGSPPH